MLDFREQLVEEIRDHLRHVLRNEEELDELQVYQQSDGNLIVDIGFKFCDSLLRLLVIGAPGWINLFLVGAVDKQYHRGKYDLREPDSIDRFLKHLESEITLRFGDKVTLTP